MKRVVVIGGGLGGLSAGIRLAHAGYSVTLLEKNGSLGGKMGIRTGDGYTFDTGPTLLTMPFVVRDLFAATGRRIEDYLHLVPVEPICRYTYSDGTVLDASNDLGATAAAIGRLHAGDGEAFSAFLRHGERIYRAAAGPFLFSPFGSHDLTGIVANARNLSAVLKIDAFRTLDRAVCGYFHDPRVRQMMNRFATYNGSSPYKAPATLAIIPYVEFAMGGWYVRGGMYRLVSALVRLAEELGVTLRTGAEVSRIDMLGRRATAVALASGETFEADAVVSNADALYAFGSLLKERVNGSVRRYTRAEPSLAGFVMLLGVEKEFPELAHHNIFFSSDYRTEFDQLFDEGRPADDPTVYVSVSCKTDPDHAPAGHSNVFVLVNAPPLTPGLDWEAEKERYGAIVLRRLEVSGMSGLTAGIRLKEIITPADFASRYHAYRGSLYGTSSNGRMAAFLRPPNRLPEFDNLFFVGGSSHPGGGIPLVLLSGGIVARLVQERLACDPG